ncbi:MAG: hypothetical protein AABZ30_00640 [Myxococcota bacterium]
MRDAIDRQDDGDDEWDDAAPYEPPAIAWEEVFALVPIGLSQPFQPGTC